VTPDRASSSPWLWAVIVASAPSLTIGIDRTSEANRSEPFREAVVHLSGDRRSSASECGMCSVFGLKQPVDLPAVEDAIREAVILEAVKEISPEACLFLSSTDNSDVYADPSPRLLSSVRQKYPKLRPSSDEQCVGDIPSLWVGPVRFISASRAEVRAGALAASLAGRPHYVLDRNSAGVWQIARINPAE